MVRFVFLIIAFSAILVRSTNAETSLPTIKVTSSYDMAFRIHEPDSEEASPYFEWTTTDSEYVLILGEEIERQLPQGRIKGGGSRIFIAIGPGGIAVQSIGAKVKAKPGTGINGIIYNFSSEFDITDFYKNSYRRTFTVSKSISQLRNIAINILQGLQYIVDDTQRLDLGSNALIYTVNFNSNPNIKALPGERAEIQRQIAFVILIAPVKDPKPSMYQILALPVMKQNYPRDNAKWDKDPDGLQLGIDACKGVVESIIKAAQ